MKTGCNGIFVGIWGNLVFAYESPCIPSAAIVRRGHRYAPAVAIPTEVLTFFRAMFWALLHPCLTTYRFIYCPNYVLIGLFRALYWASHSMSPRASRVSPVSPRTLTPETSSGRRRTPGVSAPPPLVWPCTTAPVLGLFCSRGQGLEKQTPAPGLPSPGEATPGSPPPRFSNTNLIARPIDALAR